MFCIPTETGTGEVCIPEFIYLFSKVREIVMNPTPFILNNLSNLNQL